MNDDLKDLQDKIARFEGERQAQDDRKESGEAEQESMNEGFRVGAELVVNIFAGVLVGVLLDRWLGTMPLFLIIFTLTGIGLAFYRIYKITEGLDDSVGFAPLQKKKKQDKRDRGSC